MPKPAKALAEVPKSNLYQLTQEAQAIYLALIESGGELSPDLEARLAKNETALAQKVDGYAYVEWYFKTQIKALKEREEDVRTIRKNAESALERLKTNIKTVMTTHGLESLTGAEYSFKLANCATKLVIDDEAAIPKDFKIIVQTTATDKERVKSALEAGLPVPGAHLEGGKQLRIREVAGKE